MYKEYNFDGLIGPTHNYAGLSFGNLASANNAGAASNPREAALQGLAKMRAAMELGLPQGFLPPQDRPHLKSLRALGFAEVDVEQAAQDIRQRDAARLCEQVQGDHMYGKDRLHTQPVPEPLTSPAIPK